MRLFLQRRTTCPECAAPTERAGIEEKPWCPACGWNRQVVLSLLKTDIAVGRFFAGLTFVAAFYAGIAHQNVELLFGLLALSMLLGILFIAIPRRQMARAQNTVELPKVGRESSADSLILEVKAAIGRMPNPRPVRMTKATVVKLVLFIVAITALLVMFLTALRTAKDWFVFAGALGLFFGIPTVSFVLAWIRERPLLSEGAYVIGRVQSQEMTGRFNTGSRIVYVFQPLGSDEIYFRASLDRSKKLFEEMPLIVFYDAANPSNNVALPCSSFEIAV
jgi:hypothetical protein